VLTPSDDDWDTSLETIRIFSYRFSRCIDYMQMGNESLKGAKEWAIEEQGSFTPLFCLEDSGGSTEFSDLLADGIRWTRAQADAARTGSALAGRPLRIIGPAVPPGVVNSASQGDPAGSRTNCGGVACEDLAELCEEDTQNKAAKGILETAKVLASDRMYFDLHFHYKSLDQAYDALGNMKDGGLAMWGPGGAFLPEGKVIFEFGPKGSPGLDQNGLKWSKLSNNVDKFLDCGNSGQPDWDTWDEMINSDQQGNPGWEEAHFESDVYGKGFQMENLLDAIELDGYAAVGYGPSVPGELANVFRIAALRVGPLSNCESFICDTDNHFSPILRYVSGWESCTGLTAGTDNYETLIGDFVVSPFDPHCASPESECDDCVKANACPDDGS